MSRRKVKPARKARASSEIDPWFGFLAARHRLIHMWGKKEGKSAEEICSLLNHHDVEQIWSLLQREPGEAIPGEYSIARALEPLSPKDEAALCAFVAEVEKRLQVGGLHGWRITRGITEPGGPVESWVEVRTAEGETFMGDGKTISEAVSRLSQWLIKAAFPGDWGQG